MGLFWRWIRRLLKLLGWTVLIAVIAVVAALNVLRTPGGQAWLRDTIVDVAKKSLPGLSLRRIEGDYTSTVSVVGIVVNDRDGEPCAAIERVEVHLSLSRLLRGVVRVDAIKIVQPRLWIRKRADGTLNLAHLVVPSKEPKKPEPNKGPAKLPDITVELGELVIENAVIALPASMAPKSPEDGRPARVLSLDLRLSARAALPHRVQTKLHLALGGLERGKPTTIDLDVAGPLDKAKLALAVVLGSHGKIDLRGTAGVDKQFKPSYDLTLALRDVGVRALGAAQLGAKMAPNLPPSLSLKLTAAGDGVPTEAGATLRAGLDIAPLAAAGAKLETLSLRAKMRGRNWTLDKLAVNASGAKLAVKGSGDFERVKADVDLRVARLSTLALPGVKLRGGLRLGVKVEGEPKGRLDARVDLRGSALVVNNTTALSALNLQVRGKDVLRAPHGSLSLRAGGLVTGGKPAPVTTASLDVTRKTPGRPAYLRVTAEGKDLAAKIGGAVSLPAKLADVSLEKIALTLTTLQARQGKRVVQLEKPIRLRYDPSRPINLPGTTLAIFGGTVTVSGRFAPKGMPRLRAKLELAGVRPPLAGLPPVSGVIEAEAKRSLTARARLSLRGAGRVELDARLPLRYRRGSPVPTLAKKPMSATVQIKRLRLARFRRLLGRKPPPLGGVLDLRLAARGPLLDPDVDLKLRVDGARFDALKNIGVALETTVRDKKTKIALRVSHAGRALVRSDVVAALDIGDAARGLNMARLRSQTLDVRLELEPTRIKRLARVHPALASLPETVAGLATLGVQVAGTLGQPRVTLKTKLAEAVVAKRKLGEVRLALNVDGESAQTRARVALDLGHIDLLRVSAKVDQPVLTLSKAYKRAGLLANVAMANIDLAQLSKLDPKLDLKGRLDLAATVEGKLLSPRARLTLGVVGARFGEVDIGKLALTASHDQTRGTKANFELRHSAGGKLSGKVALDARKQLDATVTARKLNLAAVEKLVEPVRQLEGTLDIDATAKGKLSAPTINASVKLDAKKLRLVGMSMLENIVARVRANPREIVLEQLSVGSGRGKLTGKARVALDAKLKPRHFTLHTNAEKFRIGAGPVQGAVYSGTVDIDAKMPKGARKVDATVTLGKTALKLPDELGKQRSLLAAGKLSDVEFVDDAALRARRKAKRTRKAGRNTGLALDIKTKADPIFLRSKQIDAEAYADLRTRISPQGTTRIGGFVAIRRGFVEIFDTRYSFDNARVAFNDSKRIDPALNLSLAANISDYRVYLGVQGTATKPDLVLRSEPPLERAQIINLILTGRLTARGGGGGSGAEAAVATAAASAVLKKIGVVDAVAGAVGLDVAKVNIDDVGAGKNAPKASAEFGKYLSRRVYIGGRVIIGAGEGENVAEGIFEYRISARWLLTAVFGDKGLGGLDALWTHRY